MFRGAADQLWLAAAVLMVSPFVAALGARRPGSRVWTCFVVLPVTVVLYLPAVTAWNRDLSPTPLRLEVPMLAGYGLVLLMGTGNYLGTRFVIPALLAAAACVGVVGPMAGFFGRSSWPISVVHPAATISLSLAAWLALRQAVGKQAVAMSGLERVWIDFRDLFGVVWGRRILDGMNTVARNENWPVRLQFDGFAAADPAKPAELSAEQSARIEQALRWFLRRFVDREWIDERRNGPLPLQ